MSRSHATTVPGSTAINVTLWIVQLLLAVAFGMAGIMKSTQPIAELTAAMGWPGDLPPVVVRFIGASELAAALGLVLPSATRIRPLLTPLAAMGLVIVMLLAALFHISRGEWGALPVNVVLGGLAAFVAWGRLRKAPIFPRA
jgi:putative oxidoreductase